MHKLGFGSLSSSKGMYFDDEDVVVSCKKRIVRLESYIQSRHQKLKEHNPMIFHLCQQKDEPKVVIFFCDEKRMLMSEN